MKYILNILATLISIFVLTISISAQEYDLHGNLIVSDTTYTGDLKIENDLYIGSLVSESKAPWVNGVTIHDPVSGKLEVNTFPLWISNVYPQSADCESNIPYWSHSGTPNQMHIGSDCSNGVSVGIGTDSPDATLDVSGTGRFSEEVGIGTLFNTNVSLLVKSNNNDIGLCLDTKTQLANNYGLKILNNNSQVKAISVTDDDAVIDNFFVSGSGGVFGRKIQLDGDASVFSKMIDVTDTNTGDEKFTVYTDGSFKGKKMELKGNGGTDRILQVTNSGQDVIRILENGKMWATAVHVRLSNQFPDYVFDQDYELMSLHDLKSYIAENNRLPNMPSAQTVTEVGVDLGEMDRLLVEKVEELTLYILQMKKEIDDLKVANQTLQNSIEK